MELHGLDLKTDWCPKPVSLEDIPDRKTHQMGEVDYGKLVAVVAAGTAVVAAGEVGRPLAAVAAAAGIAAAAEEAAAARKYDAGRN